MTAKFPDGRNREVSGALRDYDTTLWFSMANSEFEEADLSKRSQELISNMKRLGAALPNSTRNPP